MDAVLYIHGKGGSADESRHYIPLFPDCFVTGLDYRSELPWEAGTEIRAAVLDLSERYENLTLIANSIGAFFSLYADLDGLIREAYFISPIVDMERLIAGMMARAGVSEEELCEKGTIRTPEGDLSWEYLSFVRSRPVHWHVPTRILYGGLDVLTSRESAEEFAERHGASLTVMERGEHWFHTEEQMRFLDAWIRSCAADRH
ncbi:MAG: alpha/beta hydrolase [Ruminococcaceae bacterium]|jgi:hypothetical protein|nr:alpha/beta hydrolase [Oscillospiraceae bacterium]